MSTTIRSLRSQPSQPDHSALGDWYARVADTPLEQLEIGDLCRALRQELGLEHLVPIAVEHLKLNANAGELFEGELASVLARIAHPFWKTNSDVLQLVRQVLISAMPCVDDDVRLELTAFVKIAEEIASSTEKRR